jgi:O-antigen ligase
VDAGVLRVSSLPRPDLGDRRTQLVLGGLLVAAVCAGLAVAVGSGDLRLAAIFASVVAAPPLILLALNRPYIVPYGLYAALVPFDDLLRLGPGGTLTKLLGALATICVLLYAVRSRHLARPPVAVWLWLAYLAWMIASLTWSADQSVGLLETQTMGALILMFAVLATAPIDEAQLRTVCSFIVAGGVAASAYGIWTMQHVPAVTDTDGTIRRLTISANGMSIDPNHFANALLAPLALSLVALTHARTPRAAFLALFAVAVLAAGILDSLSREAVLAALLMAIVLVWFSRRRLLGLALGVPAVALTLFAVPAIGTRMNEAFATGGAGRMSIWQVAIAAWQAHPLIGWGEGGAFEAYDRYYLRVFQLYNAGWSRPPHNAGLTALVDLGIVGLVLLVAAFVATALLVRRIPRGDSLFDLRVALTAALIGLAFSSLFIDLTNYKYLWLVLAAAAQLAAVAHARTRRLPA